MRESKRATPTSGLVEMELRQEVGGDVAGDTEKADAVRGVGGRDK